jgi:RNA polymerase sigma-70 factor (ECF subfamily)
MNALSATINTTDPMIYRAGLALDRRADDEPSAKATRCSSLMRAAQDGDCAAYAALLHEILPLLQRLVRGRLRFLPAADHEDLVQDILLSIHAGRATYDPSRPFMPWLRSIAHHRMVDGARRSGRRTAKELLIDDCAESVADRPSIEEDAYGDPQALRRAVNDLPARQRTAIELVKLRELSLIEASELSGIGISALKLSVHRAIKNLRNSLA